MGRVNLTTSIVPRWKLAVAVITLSFVFLFIRFLGPISLKQARNSKMAVTHIVLFQFKSSASPEEIKDVRCHLYSYIADVAKSKN
jgi:hypothetical protein